MRYILKHACTFCEHVCIVEHGRLFGRRGTCPWSNPGIVEHGRLIGARGTFMLIKFAGMPVFFKLNCLGKMQTHLLNGVQLYTTA